VKRVVKVLGIVNATDDFTRHPQVINGASDLFVAVFGAWPPRAVCRRRGVAADEHRGGD
jgi:hypothetical protein